MKKKKKSKSQNNISPLHERERRKIKLVSYIFPVVTFMLFVVVYKEFLLNNQAPLNFRMVWAIILGLLLPARGATGRTIDELLDAKEIQPKKIRLVYKVFNVVSVLIIVLLVFPPLYYSPIREKLSEILLAQVFSKKIADYISSIFTALLSGISGYIGNIILGVLGNLATDLIKKIYQQRTNRAKKNKGSPVINMKEPKHKDHKGAQRGKLS